MVKFFSELNELLNSETNVDPQLGASVSEIQNSFFQIKEIMIKKYGNTRELKDNILIAPYTITSITEKEFNESV